MKKLGMLMPISSLPSKYGIGDFGYEAYHIIDKLHENKISVWQILPMHPSMEANSPYRAMTTYGGDEIYISLDKLVEEKLLDQHDVMPFFKDSKWVQYDLIRIFKNMYLRNAYKRFVKDEQYYEFEKKQSWLESYAIFRTFMQIEKTHKWPEWRDEFKNYPYDHNVDLQPYQDEIEYQKFVQYMFYKQWQELKKYANDRGVEFFGDLPFYMDVNSVEVWCDHESFLLDERYNPSVVAGVPPDYFSKTGQNWGNPIYNWEYLEKHNFGFWIERLRYARELYDLVRIDHFRAFDSYWVIPAGEETAINGKWQYAPGYKLFDTIYKELPGINIIAEDLGDLRKEVYELKDHYKLPGMRVFQFQFWESFDKLENEILYTGTHDNDTLLGFFESLDKNGRDHLQWLTGAKGKEDLLEKVLKFGIEKASMKQMFVPIWDLLLLESKYRFNIPGKVDVNNWSMRISDLDKVLYGIDLYGKYTGGNK